MEDSIPFESISKKNLQKERIKEKQKNIFILLESNFVLFPRVEAFFLALESKYWMVLAILSAIIGFIFLKIYSSLKTYFSPFDNCDFSRNALGIAVMMLISSLICLVYYYVTCPQTYKKFIGSNRYYHYINSVSCAFLTLTMLASLYLYQTEKLSNGPFEVGFYEKQHGYRKSESIRRHIDLLQSDLRCCGEYNFTQWFEIAWSKNLKKNEVGFPMSCCQVVPEDFHCENIASHDNVWKLTPWVDGCAEKMKEYYLKQSLTSYNLLILATIAYVLILIISTINVVSVARHELKMERGWYDYMKERICNYSDMRSLMDELVETESSVKEVKQNEDNSITL